jgi:hypothetical protein
MSMRTRREEWIGERREEEEEEQEQEEQVQEQYGKLERE